MAGAGEPARAHPAHAEPVNYPFVVGFERFHSSIDDDDYLAEGGFILLNELNCVACHPPPARLADRLPGVTATDLSGVATRLNHLDLELMIRNPRFAKRDTVMPSLFAGPDRDLREVEALKHYLATLEVELPGYPEGDVEAGRRLYHRIGCVACHAPEVGYRPGGIPDNVEIELAGLPSVPLNLADLYDPRRARPFPASPGGAPTLGTDARLHLTEAEAADLATYLKAGPQRELPGNLSTRWRAPSPSGSIRRWRSGGARCSSVVGARRATRFRARGKGSRRRGRRRWPGSTRRRAAPAFGTTRGGRSALLRARRGATPRHRRRAGAARPVGTGDDRAAGWIAA